MCERKLEKCLHQFVFKGYMFDLYVDDGSNQSSVPQHKGSAHLLPVSLKDTFGFRTIAINGTRHKPIGELTGQI